MARRALLLAGVALVASGVALVAAIVDSSGTDTVGTSTADRAAAEQLQAAAAAAQAEAEEAAVIAGAAASRADEAAVVAREAGMMAQQAVAEAEEAAAQAAASLEAFATARAEAAVADAFGTDSETGAQPAETPQDAAGTEAETDETGSQSGADAAEEEPAESQTPAGEADATVGESDAATADGADAASTDGTGQPPTEPDVSLPGEPFEFGPPEGAALAVVGVSHDSVLNVRDVPAGALVARLDNVMNVDGQPVVYVREAGSDELIATLDLNRGVIATGNTRRLPTTVWHEIRLGDAVGWASAAYLAPLGATSDSTAEIVATLGETPSAPTLAELARIVAEAVASEEPPSRIVVSGAPVVGDLGEITVDVLGLPDDSVRGFRLHVYAQQDPESALFALRTVESTTICDSHRGVGEGGLCN